MVGVGMRMHQEPIVPRWTSWSTPLSEKSMSQRKGEVYISMAGSHGNKGVSVVQASGNFCAFARTFPINYLLTVLDLESYDHRKHLICFQRAEEGTT